MSLPFGPVPDAALDDLASRLASTRRVPLPPGVGWARGTDEDYLTALLASWRDDYDWRAHERRILELPWTTAAGLNLVRTTPASPSGSAPIVLLHGWPDSVLRFERVLPLLGDREVIVPALPGYPFSAGPVEVGMSGARMADRVASALDELGIDRYVVSGGDIGSGVATTLAAERPEAVAALHLTDLPWRFAFTVEPAELDDAERDYADTGRAWQMAEGAYALEQATKPHTLAVGLGDSPAGLAAWIVEKLRSWSDTGITGDLETVFSRDDVLTWVSAYWLTDAIGSSFSPYIESAPVPDHQITVPTGFTMFPHDLVQAPRSMAERFFDVRDWVEEPSGGHFAAWERPEAFVAGVKRAAAFAE